MEETDNKRLTCWDKMCAKERARDHTLHAVSQWTATRCTYNVHTSHSDLFQSKCLSHTISSHLHVQWFQCVWIYEKKKMNNYNHISSQVHTRLYSLHTPNGRKLLLLIMRHSRFTSCASLFRTFKGTSQFTHKPLTVTAAAAILIWVDCVRCWPPQSPFFSSCEANFHVVT